MSKSILLRPARRRDKMKNYDQPILSSAFIFLIISFVFLVSITILGYIPAAHGQQQDNSLRAQVIILDNTSAQKVRVNDIDIAYKIFGKGKPLLFIAGSGASMDMWDPTVLRELSANHTVVIFDSRGKGQTSAGIIKNMTMSQFANDTAGLIEALGIQKPVDMLGVSLGGFIAQELALLHPEKIDRLILYASDCSGKIAVPARPAPFAATPVDQARIVADMIFPQQWKKEHPNYLSYMPLVPVPSLKAIQLEGQAVSNWKGSCARISNINKSTLVMVGTDDIVIPPSYSLPLAQRIPGAWLVQIEGGGHGLMYQYPEKFAKVLGTFLAVTK